MQHNLLQEALNENRTAERLQELIKSSDESVCIAIAKNPNTPPDVLLELFYDFPTHVLNNPILEFLILENPNFFAELYEANNKVFSYEDIPLFFIQWAINQPDEYIGLAVASSENIPEFILELLAKDKSTEIRRLIALNPKIPNHILDKLAIDKDIYVRGNIAYNPNTKEQTLKLLSQHVFYLLYFVFEL